MKSFLLSMCAVTVLTGAALAQTSAQASMTASQNSSASVNHSGADVNSNANAGASANATRNHNGEFRQAGASSQMASGTAFHAVLEKPVDARKCKTGDQVFAKSTENVKSHGKVVLPKGSRLVGHVTEAKARAKGQSQSAVGIVFDHAILKDGSTVPFHASIRAIAESQQAASAAMMNNGMSDDSMAAGSAMGSVSAAPRAGSGLVGGATQTVGVSGGALVNSAANVPGNVGMGAGAVSRTALSPTGELNTESSGIVGLNGLSLNGALANSTEGSVITSSTRNVHLDSGTQMILQTR